MYNEIIKAGEEFEKGNLSVSCQILTEVLTRDLNNLDALMLRAKVYYKWQKWGDSLNDLNRILEIDENHQMALNYKQMVMNILTYWNKDQYNP